MPADELVFLGNFVVLGVAAVGAVAAARPPMRLKRSMISSKGNPQITS